MSSKGIFKLAEEDGFKEITLQRANSPASSKNYAEVNVQIVLPA